DASVLLAHEAAEDDHAHLHLEGDDLLLHALDPLLLLTRADVILTELEEHVVSFHRVDDVLAVADSIGVGAGVSRRPYLRCPLLRRRRAHQERREFRNQVIYVPPEATLAHPNRNAELGDGFSARFSVPANHVRPWRSPAGPNLMSSLVLSEAHTRPRGAGH